jgi:hypothetical protein
MNARRHGGIRSLLKRSTHMRATDSSSTLRGADDTSFCVSFDVLVADFTDKKVLSKFFQIILFKKARIFCIHIFILTAKEINGSQF